MEDLDLFEIFRKITKSKIPDLEIINLALDSFFSNPIFSVNPFRIEKIHKFDKKVVVLLNNGKKIEFRFKKNRL